ncbi:MAG: phosphate acyltransferase [Syntrophales bacterium]|jgi:phosphate butyryltransferase
MAGTFADIIEAARKKAAKRRLAISSVKKSDLEIISKAAKEGLIFPVLVGDGKAMETLVKKSHLASLEHEIMDVKDAGGFLRAAVALVREGRADMLMQGAEDLKSFMKAVLDANTGLLKGKLASYVSVFQLPKSDKLVLVTDTFVNNYPGVTEKQVILEQAINLAGLLGIEAPKVAVLAAIEQVNPSIPSTLDAAVLSKMGERKQFGNAIVEGPLDIDCALSHVAAARKGIKSVVTGNVDIYLVPDIESGYLLAQSLVFIGKMEMAGVLMGMTKPVILNIPFVSRGNRLVEIALASLI